MREMILLVFFEKGTFPYKGNVLKQKKKNQKKNKKRKEAKIFLNILRMNQRTLTMICLKIILIFQYLVLWQKKLYTTKNKNKNNELVELSKVR